MQGDGGLESAWICDILFCQSSAQVQELQQLCQRYHPKTFHQAIPGYNLLLVYRFDRRHQAF